MKQSVIKILARRRNQVRKMLEKNPLFIELNELEEVLMGIEGNSSKKTRAKRTPQRKSPLEKVKHGNRLVTLHNAVMETFKKAHSDTVELTEVVDRLRENFGIRFPRGQAGGYIRNYLELYMKAKKDFDHRFEYYNAEGKKKKGRDGVKIDKIRLVVNKSENKQSKQSPARAVGTVSA